MKPTNETPKKSRRRLTDEERIAEREAEIAEIATTQGRLRERNRHRQVVASSLSDACHALELAVMMAERCGMAEASERCRRALIALGEDWAGEEVGL